MTTGDESKQPTSEDLDVRKPAVRIRRAGAAQSRRSIVAAAELLGGISMASAEAFRSLNTALAPEAVTRSGLPASVYIGIREGNVRFLEELSRTSRRVFDALRPPGPGEPDGEPGVPGRAPEPIDYERLAKLVAAEMSKRPHTRADTPR